VTVLSLLHTSLSPELRVLVITQMPVILMHLFSVTSANIAISYNNIIARN